MSIIQSHTSHTDSFKEGFWSKVRRILSIEGQDRNAKRSMSEGTNILIE